MGVYNNDNGVLSPIAGRGNLDGVYRANGILGAKNLLKVPYHHSTGVEFPVGGSVTHVGITYTHNADHSITVNGTATGSSYCIFNRKQDWSEFDLYGKEVTLSVSPVSNSVFLQLYDTDNSRMVCRTDSSTGEVTFTFPAELKNNTSWNISINIPNGTTVNNVTYYPMLRLASDTDSTYVPYAPTNAKLNEEKMSYADNGVLGAKNLLKNTATTQTINNVAFTVNSDDKTVNVTRTAEQTEIATRDLYVVSDEEYKLLAGKTLLMTGCPSGGSNDTYYLECYYNDGTGHWLRDIGNGLKITLPATKPTTIRFLIGIKVASVIPSGGLTFKPMLRLASDPDNTYVPYAMTNKELTENVAEIKSDLLYSEIKSSGSISETINANSVKAINIDVTKTGYIPIGIIGIDKTGTSTGYGAIVSFRISNNDAVVTIDNTSTSSITITKIDVTILYKKA